MGWTHAARVTGLVLLVFAGLLVLLAILGLPAAVRGLPPDATAALLIVTAFLRIVYFIALFFMFPHGLLLRALRIDRRWVFVFVGALSGWFFLATVLISNDWFARAAAAPSFGDAVGIFSTVFLLQPGRVLQTIWYAAGPQGLMVSALFGVLFGFIWQMKIYRLPTDQGRDWEPRVLGQQPPYDGNI